MRSKTKKIPYLFPLFLLFLLIFQGHHHTKTNVSPNVPFLYLMKNIKKILTCNFVLMIFLVGELEKPGQNERCAFLSSQNGCDYKKSKTLKNKLSFPQKSRSLVPIDLSASQKDSGTNKCEYKHLDILRTKIDYGDIHGATVYLWMS